MTARRIIAGLYETATGYRIERVSAEARHAGYSDGWHLFNPRGEYVDTYATKRDAVNDADAGGSND